MDDIAEKTAQQTRVDFYQLAGANTQNIQLFCCRLAEKAWKLGNTVFIRTEDEQQAQHLDNLMWTYSDGGFLPHGRETDTQQSETPVIIGSKTQPVDSYDLMINLASEIPEHCNHYARIAEIINEDEIIRSQARVRYSHYDKNNCSLKHHKISA